MFYVVNTLNVRDDVAMRNTLLVLFLFLSLLSLDAFSAKHEVIAKAILSRGDVSVLFPGASKAVQLRKGDHLYRDTSILTGGNGIAKIKFIDGSTTSIGNKSKLLLIKGGKRKSTLVGLLKGKIRSTIGATAKKTKRKDNYKHMLIIKTRSASIGVRGTDLLSVHNPKNKVTSLLVFDGTVEISKIKNNHLLPVMKNKILGRLGHDDYEVILNSDESEIVRQGHYSGVVPAHESTTVPVRISPVQFLLLKKNKDLDFSIKGVPVNSIDADPREIYGSDQIGDAPPEGFYNKETGSFAPKSGGFIDLSTALYVQPEVDSKYDKKFKVYKLSSQYGGADSKNGDFVTPKGLLLTPNRGFQLKDIDDGQKIKIATEVFGLDSKKKLAPKVKKKLRKSLDQVLALKKSILNNELREDMLKEDLGEEDFIEHISRDFQNALRSIHEVLDMDGMLRLTHLSNVSDRLQGELVKNTGVKGTLFDFNLTVTHNNYLLSNWVIVPYLGFSVKSYFLENDKNLKDVGQSSIFAGIKNTISYKAFDHKSNLNINIGIHKTTKLNSTHNNYLGPYDVDSEQRNESRALFERALTFDVFNKFYLTKWQYLKVGYQLSNVDAFSSLLNGEYSKPYVSYSLRFLPRFELIPYYSKNKRESLSDLGSSEGSDKRLEFNIHNISEIYTFYSSYFVHKMKFLNQSLFSQRGEEKRKGFEMKVTREIGDNLSIDISLKHDKNESLDVESTYSSNDLGFGLRYSY